MGLKAKGLLLLLEESRAKTLAAGAAPLRAPTPAPYRDPRSKELVQISHLISQNSGFIL